MHVFWSSSPIHQLRLRLHRWRCYSPADGHISMSVPCGMASKDDQTTLDLLGSSALAWPRNTLRKPPPRGACEITYKAIVWPYALETRRLECCNVPLVPSVGKAWHYIQWNFILKILLKICPQNQETRQRGVDLKLLDNELPIDMTNFTFQIRPKLLNPHTGS